jgi:hypothetical protein
VLRHGETAIGCRSGHDDCAAGPGQTKGAGAKGAAKGAAVGAIAGDAGAGAVVNAVHGRRKEKRAERKTDDQAQNTQQSMDVFKKPFSSCMTGRKYAVK